MRRNQISVNITRYNEAVPKAWPEKHQVINVYSDSNNLFECLCMAFTQTVNVIREWQPIASRTDIVTNADQNIAGAFLGKRYEDEFGMQYLEERYNLQKDLLFNLENSQEIIEILKMSDNKSTAKEKLTERFGLSHSQVTNLFRVRFDMFTQEEIEEIKKDIARIENHAHESLNRKSQINNKED